MNIAAIFIRRPVMTTLVMLAILLFGVMAYRQLPVSDLPNVDFPTIQVSAGLPGANPETMASSVATPLERQFSTIAGLDSMISSSTLGGTSITLQFNLSRNIDAAAQDVQAAIAASVRQLPPNMPAPPSYNKVNPADQPVLYLAINSDTMPLVRIQEIEQGIIKRVLDIGAAGIVVPQVHTPDEAERAVRFAKYPPWGLRGVGAARATHWGMGLKSDTLIANSETLVIPIMETVSAGQNVEEICDIPGVDAIFFGPADYSASSGALDAA